MQRYAIFDLDETITIRGTWGRFVSLSVKNKPFKLLGLWTRAALGQLIYKFGPTERISVKRGMLRWSLAGQTREHLETLASEFADREVESGLRPGAIRQIEEHRKAGDRIIIASAAADIIVRPIADRLKIEDIVCTELAWVDGKCASDFGSENCYGPGKLRMLTKRLETFDDFRRGSVHITMYTDSYSDLPVLNYADKGVAVNADARLRKAAPVHGFATVNWST